MSAFGHRCLLATALSLSFVYNSLISSELTTCLESFPAPEILHDLYDCLIVLDWNPYFTQDCRQLATGYEVQYLKGPSSESDGDLFENQTNSIINDTLFILPKKIPGECSMSINCYVRMRFWLSSLQWSKYSMWTTLSDNYEATQGYIFNFIVPIGADGIAKCIITII